VSHDFGTGTRGFAAVDDSALAVCLMPGTELAFAEEVAIFPHGLLGWRKKTPHITMPSNFLMGGSSC
jgi:hypothetical protein